MSEENYKPIIEALLLAADEPLSISRLQNLLSTENNSITTEKIQQCIIDLQRDYDDRGISLMEVASGYCFRVDQKYAPWVSKLWELKPPRYSRALLETLALIAYKQPITRAEIEEVRGVSVSSQIIKNLLEREWVKVVGHRDIPGKPALFATTKLFLDYFNLKSITELPTLAELKNLDQIEQQLEMQLQEMEALEG